MSEPQFSLSDYLSTVQEVIQITFNEPVWVKAEIRNLNIKGGHYYLELAEKDESTDKVIASCKGTIWKFTAQKMVLKFERESGVELSKDLNVLVKVRAKFDPQYGFSVNIEDIDSSYTFGDIARRYQQILERLTSEGLLNKNKLIPIRKGFDECFRMLANGGVLIFKWNKTQIKVSETLVLTDQKPVFGHISGKRANTHWITFMKLDLHTGES